jgi:hypothetical protein
VNDRAVSDEEAARLLFGQGGLARLIASILSISAGEIDPNEFLTKFSNRPCDLGV